MPEKFNAFEIFEMAEQVERNGARFYRRAAELAQDEAARELLLSLAGMEETHERTFAEMKQELATGEEAAARLESYGETVHYLRAFADGLLFDPHAGTAERITPETSLKEILQMAIAAEKDSIAIYVGLRNLVPDAAGRERVDTIIREEMSHASVLSEHLATHLRHAGPRAE
ncbi:MAG: rubrerythrin [Candidatus Eisenbacteria bacterium]|nr:rubrerythrin [Candidatus Eisenbacteria bacterium]